jgi:hypothetical protein
MADTSTTTACPEAAEYALLSVILFCTIYIFKFVKSGERIFVLATATK